MSEKKLPQKLKELRKVNNYTQDYVAAVLGIVRQTYSHYETAEILLIKYLISYPHFRGFFLPRL